MVKRQALRPDAVLRSYRIGAVRILLVDEIDQSFLGREDKYIAGKQGVCGFLTLSSKFTVV